MANIERSQKFQIQEVTAGKEYSFLHGTVIWSDKAIKPSLGFQQSLSIREYELPRPDRP